MKLKKNNKKHETWARKKKKSVQKCLGFLLLQFENKKNTIYLNA